MGQGAGPTRIVEDNSPCAYDHVETDINTWHFTSTVMNPLRNHIEEIVRRPIQGPNTTISAAISKATLAHEQ